jgi:hypothetical protein
MVTPEAPVKAVKKAQAQSAISARPPGSHPIRPACSVPDAARLAGSQDIASEGKQRNGQQGWCTGETIEFDHDGRGVNASSPEQEPGEGAEHTNNGVPNIARNTSSRPRRIMLRPLAGPIGPVSPPDARRNVV